MYKSLTPSIGLEVHVQLKTDSKLFCSCPVVFGASPNSLTCPICAGHPGTLPVLNKKALHLAIKAGLCLNLGISEYIGFDRKNYFYPDLPKGYQITQYEMPICKPGSVKVTTADGARNIGIIRIHMEEDSGKSIHDEIGNRTMIDLNRCGIPLIEIVTEPDITSAAEAHEFLLSLRRTLRYAEVADCEMQEGGMRVDVNVSLAHEDGGRGVPVEIKNLGSLKSVAMAIDFEIARQARARLANEEIVRETRLFDEQTATTRRTRGKEERHEYRYFPEPDLPAFKISTELVENLRDELCEAPEARYTRYIEEQGLTGYEAGILVEHREVSDFFDSVLKRCNSPKAACNWMLGEVLSLRNDFKGLGNIQNMTPSGVAELVEMVCSGTLTLTSARAEVWPRYIAGEGMPREIALQLGLLVDGEVNISRLVGEIANGNPDIVMQISKGKVSAVEVLVGMLMKRTKGTANPDAAREEFLRFLAEQGNRHTIG